jgi:Fe-S cluster assembly protein SufD
MDLVSTATTLKTFLQNPPGRAQEDWKYTDFTFFKKQEYVLSTASDNNSAQYVPEEKKIVITLRSPFSKEWSLQNLPPGLQITTDDLQKTPELEGYFDKINSQLPITRSKLVFDEKFDSALLVELVLHGKETMMPQHQFVNKSVQIVLKAGASVFLVEKTYLNQKQFVNMNTQYLLEENAKLELLKIEKGQADGRGCQTSFFSLSQNAEVQATTAVMGGEWSRHNLHAHLVEKDARAQFLSASVLNNSEYVDHHTWIDHKVGNTQSMQRYINVINDDAHAVFNGRVFIHRDAQKSSAEQSNKNLLLSQKARIDTKPELVIEADDVKAKHGATVGQLNADELFYLRSRGINKEQAQTMLMKGFVNDISDRLSPRFKGIFLQEMASAVKATAHE